MVLDIRRHRIVMINILKDIVTSPYGKILWFKGGTLLYLFYNLDRFSTDLDFDLLDKEADWQKVLQDISTICMKYWKIKDVYDKQNTLFLLIDYESNQMNIKIEINKKNSKYDKYSFKTILGYQSLCMDPDCLFANKLVALTNRNRIVSRDLYDIHFFLRNWFEINEKIIKDRLGKTLMEYIVDLKIFIKKNFNSNNLLAGLWEVIDEKQKTFVKENLIDEVCGYLDHI